MAKIIRLHTLVVEASSVQTKIICRHFTSMSSFTTVHAETMHEAGKLLYENKEHIFAVVAGLNLEDAPHGEIIDLIHKHNLPVVVLTATFKQEIRNTMLEKNVADYLIKADINILDRVLEVVVRLYKNQFIKVLLVGNSQAFCDLACGLLKGQNYQVKQAEDGQKALYAMEEEPSIQLVITDYEMPVLDGFGLCEALRKKFTKQELGIIGVSGADQPAMAARFLKYGANDFIAKPFQADEFSWRVNQTMEGLETAQSLFTCQKELKKALSQG